MDQIVQKTLIHKIQGMKKSSVTVKELKDSGFNFNKGLMCYDLWTENSNILIRYYVDNKDVLANCFISTYSDSTMVYPESINDIKTLINLLTP